MDCPLCGHAKPHARLAFAPNDRGLSLGHSTSLSAAGPRQILWSGITSSHSSDGDHGGHHRAAISVAEPTYAERLIGSIRRECLDHVIIFSERHLRHVLSSYFQYHHDTRTHLSLGKECPRPRPIQPLSAGNIIAFPEVGGLHHRYERPA